VACGKEERGWREGGGVGVGVRVEGWRGERRGERGGRVVASGDRQGPR
jgi:hypothetical protein